MKFSASLLIDLLADETADTVTVEHFVIGVRNTCEWRTS